MDSASLKKLFFRVRFSRRRKSISSLIITSSGFFFFSFSCVFQKMELDFDAGNLLEDEAGEVGHNVSVKLGPFCAYFRRFWLT